MKILFCFYLLMTLISCTSAKKGTLNPESTELPPDAAPSNTSPSAAPVVVPQAPLPQVTPCGKYGSKTNFNDQRIVAFQKLLQTEILKVKSQAMTQESTQELSMLETIRRRASAPLLSPGLRPEAVTKIISREAKNLIAVLELQRQSEPQILSVMQQLDNLFVKLINNQDHWNCIENQTDFQEDKTDEIN